MKRCAVLGIAGLLAVGSVFAGDRSKKSYEGFLGKAVVNAGQSHNQKIFQNIGSNDAGRNKRRELKKSLDKLGLIGGFSDAIEGIIDDFDSFGWEQTKFGFRKNRLEVKYTPKTSWIKNIEFGVYGGNRYRYGVQDYSIGIMIKIPF